MDEKSQARAISKEEISTFQNDGIVCLRGLFNADWIFRLREAAEICMQSPGELHAELAEERRDGGRFFHDTFVWRRNETCRDFVFNSPAAQVASQLMRASKINIFFDQWLIKEPGTTTKTPWHHDVTYWPVQGDQLCTLWLALDPVTADTGAVEYIKGSHRWGKKFRPASFGKGNQYTEDIPNVPDIDSARDTFDIVQFDLEPGDCTVHHGLTVHSAPGNLSASLRRRAHTSRWAGDDVVFHPREGLQEMPAMPDIPAGGSIDSELWPRVIG